MTTTKYKIISEFINTPSRKLVTFGRDFTVGGDDIKEFDAALASLPAAEIKGSCVKISLKAYQDDASVLNKEEIEKAYLEAGAKDVKVEIKRVPRETVRSETITQLDTLADKLEEQAKIKAETLPDGVKDIANDLETLTEDELYAKVTAGYTYGAGAEASAS